jgi:hypothetical protein
MALRKQISPRRFGARSSNPRDERQIKNYRIAEVRHWLYGL